MCVSPYDFTALVFSFALLSLEISKMQEPHHLFRQFLGKSHRSSPIVLLYLAQEKKIVKSKRKLKKKKLKKARPQPPPQPRIGLLFCLDLYIFSLVLFF